MVRAGVGSSGQGRVVSSGLGVGQKRGREEALGLLSVNTRLPDDVLANEGEIWPCGG